MPNYIQPVNDFDFNTALPINEQMFRELALNPTYIVLRCEKAGEVNSPAKIRLEKGSTSVKDYIQVAKKYLDYTPEVLMEYKLHDDSIITLVATDVLTGEQSSYLKDDIINKY